MTWRIISETTETTPYRRRVHREFQCGSCGAVYGTDEDPPFLCRCGTCGGIAPNPGSPLAESDRSCSGRILYVDPAAWSGVAVADVRALDLSALEFPVRDGFCDVEVLRDPSGYTDILLPLVAVAEPQVWVSGCRTLGLWCAEKRSYHMVRRVPDGALVRIRWMVVSREEDACG